MKVVIDTNILISGSYDESSHSFKILQEVIAGKIQACATHQTMSENRQMLRKLVKDRNYRTLLESYFQKLQVTKLFRPLQVVADPEDNKLFESAVSAGAQYIITEDREVLDVEVYRDVKVITPEDFWAVYENQSGSDSAWQDWTKIVMGK